MFVAWNNLSKTRVDPNPVLPNASLLSLPNPHSTTALEYLLFPVRVGLLPPYPLPRATPRSQWRLRYDYLIIQSNWLPILRFNKVYVYNPLTVSLHPSHFFPLTPLTPSLKLLN